MSKDTHLNYGLQRMLCTRAASALRNLETTIGISPSPALNKAIDAKLAYLDGKCTAEELEGLRIKAEAVRLELMRIMFSDRSFAARASYHAAEAAVCAASEEQGPDVDDPFIDAWMERYLLTGG